MPGSQGANGQKTRAMSGALPKENRLAAGAGAAAVDGMSNARIFRDFKTSPEIIRLVVMMSVRYPLSLRQVKDLRHECSIDITHETVWFWWNRFGTISCCQDLPESGPGDAAFPALGMASR